jgi:predicted small secreted protein
MRKNLLLALLALLALLPAFTACNTMQGLGQDISNGGKDLEGAADRNK